MQVLQALRWLLLGMEAIIALPILYLCIVSISAIRATKKRSNKVSLSSSTPVYVNFAILIPAHNEIAVLGKMLESLGNLDYPKDCYTVYVVADNCTDTTAELARSTGWVGVYERYDREKRGKGFALNWLLQQLKEDQLIYDAYIILDADSVVEASFLQALNRQFAYGGRAFQASYTVLNAADSPSAALRWIALSLVNHVRPLGRNGLGASANLAGNGMCFSRELLEQYPWQAFSLTEDYEYYLTLVQNGERIRYVQNAIVRSAMPTTFAQMRTQDVRWEAYQSDKPKWRTAWELLKAGMKSRDFVRIEAIAELLTPPLSLLFGWCLLTLTGSLLLWSLPDLLINFLLLGGLICYISSAIYLLHPPRSVLLALLHAPGFMLWKLWVLFVLRRSKKHRAEWIRTSRTAEK